METFMVEYLAKPIKIFLKTPYISFEKRFRILNVEYNNVFNI